MFSVSDLQFGEIDAKNEVFQQARYGISVLRNSFQVPPRVNLDELLLGARFFISGQKGCGKTALLLHVEDELRRAGASTHIVLFKSNIGEAERAKLSSGSRIEIINTGGGLSVEYDYSVNWLWFIYKNLLRLLADDDVAEGKDLATDFKRLFGVLNETKSSHFGDLALAKVRGAAKLGLNSGPFSAQLDGEVEAIKKEDVDRIPIEIIEIFEKYIPKIRLKPRKRCLIFFDELELFWNRPDQRERDLFLIRDLLRSVARVNRVLGAQSASFVVYASVRSEVLEEINRVGPEIVRDINDFGVSINWNVKVAAEHQPILQIVEAKIQYSEIENERIPTEDVWSFYFPDRIYGKNIRSHLLDIAMFKPRNIISRLNLAKKHAPTADKFSREAFEQTSTDFAQTVWREIEEELLGRYSAQEVSNIKSIFTGFKPYFKIHELEKRIELLGSVDFTLAQGFQTRQQVVNVCRALYRLGALGNQFFVQSPGRSKKETRDRWSFREMTDPVINETFIVHESLRKVFQMTF